MSKIAIISRGDQAILVDISGCLAFKEAIEQLSTTLLSTNQFWQGQTVDLNFGSLLLNKSQVAQVVALANGVGASPKQIYAKNMQTLAALEELKIHAIKGNPTQVSSVALLPAETVIVEKPTEKINAEAVKIEPEKVEKTESKEVDTTFERIVMYEEASQEPQVQTKDDVKIENDSNLETKEGIVELATDIIENESEHKKQTLYLKQTLRAGQAVSHKGDLVIIGDVNAGAEVLAEGDITIWGSLRGIAHAGFGGNINAEIRALRLQPIQIRIANYIARSPDQPIFSGSISQAVRGEAETAKLVDGKIRILRNTFD